MIKPYPQTTWNLARDIELVRRGYALGRENQPRGDRIYLTPNRDSEIWLEVIGAVDSYIPQITKIHVVIGSTGEYSGRHEWLVAAYTDPDKARLRVLACDATVRELIAAGWRDIQTQYTYNVNAELDDVYEKSDPRWPKPESDPQITMIASEVRYRIEQVELA